MPARLFTAPLMPLPPWCGLPTPLGLPGEWHDAGRPLIGRVLATPDGPLVPHLVAETLLPAWHAATPRRGLLAAVLGERDALHPVVDALTARFGLPTGLGAPPRSPAVIGRTRLIRGARTFTFPVDTLDDARAAVLGPGRARLVFGATDLDALAVTLAARPADLTARLEALATCAAVVTADVFDDRLRLLIEAADPAVAEALAAVTEPATIDDWCADRWQTETDPQGASLATAAALTLHGEGTLTHLAGAAARSVDLGHTPWVDVDALARLPHLEALSTFGDCWRLTPLTGLRRLRLWCEPIAGPAALALPTLEALDIARITPAAVRALAACPRLRTLTLGDPASRADAIITPEGADRAAAVAATLDSLAALPALEDLALNEHTLTDLHFVTALPRLTRLAIDRDRPHLQDPPPLDLTPLAALPALRHLELTGAGPVDLTPLAGLQIESLRLDAPGIDLTPLTTLPALTALHLEFGTPDTALIARLTPLRELDLRFADVDLAPLAALPHLRRLDLSGARVHDAAHAAQRLPGVEITGLWIDP